MSYFRHNSEFQDFECEEWLCPHIILPESLASVKTRCQVAGSLRPRRTARFGKTGVLFHPIFSDCSVELNFKGKYHKKVSITCDAVVATILSLFETSGTLVRRSEIEEKTGVKSLLLSAVMEQLCMKRPKDGLVTSLLQVL
jgi:hypothetical protein